MNTYTEHTPQTYRFWDILVTPLPDPPADKQHVARRRLGLCTLILLCAFTGWYCFRTYHHDAMISTLGVLLILLIFTVSDLASSSTKIASHVAGIAMLPIFLAILFSRTGGVVSLLWSILIPPMAVMICGLLRGSLISAFFLCLFSAAFLTDLRIPLPNIYPVEVTAVFPFIYIFAFAVSFSAEYQIKKKTLTFYAENTALAAEKESAKQEYSIITRETILAIVKAVDAKDAYTSGHSSRVAKYSAMLAERLGWSKDQIEDLYQIALLHDIGKIGVEDAILKKSSHLSDEEYEKIKSHTLIGEAILKDMPHLTRAYIGAVAHHERFDGKGYPRGLQGNWIPIEARIIGIADAFDAMNSSRVYRTKRPKQFIMDQLRNGAGTQFDPKLLEAFLPIAESILNQSE